MIREKVSGPVSKFGAHILFCSLRIDGELHIVAIDSFFLRSLLDSHEYIPSASGITTGIATIAIIFANRSKISNFVCFIWGSGWVSSDPRARLLVNLSRH